MNINCELINDLLPLYVDEVISEEGKKLVEEHFTSCEKCSKAVQNMKTSLTIPMDNDASKIRGLKKKYTMSIWLRVVIIAAALVAVWVAVSYTVMSRWTEVFPKADLEDIRDCTEIVIIGDKYYLHTNEIFGAGVPVYVSGDEDEYHFYLGENGIHNLGLGRSYQMRESMYQVGTVGVTRKIVYSKPDGSAEITLFEEGDTVTVLEGSLKEFEN